METQALIIFAKNPVLGKVKTRLAAAVGEEKALRVYLQLLDVVYSYTSLLSVKKIIYWDGGIPSNSPFTGEIYTHKLQSHGDLGKKMSDAIATELNYFKSVCIIGTDCAELNQRILEESFHALKTKDMVIGPAMDGGYYLIGMKRSYPEIFEEMEWSTSTVYDHTIAKIKKRNLTYFDLPRLNDLDTYSDLLKMADQKLIRL